MPCYRCGARQVDPDRGESPWRRGVRADRQVLICPGCQSSFDWVAELDHCRYARACTWSGGSAKSSAGTAGRSGSRLLVLLVLQALQALLVLRGRLVRLEGLRAARIRRAAGSWRAA